MTAKSAARCRIRANRATNVCSRNRCVDLVAVRHALPPRDGVALRKTCRLLRQITAVIPITVCALALTVRSGSAQQATSTRPISTAAGVYTSEQALRGRDAYAAACQGCHNAATHSSPAFLRAWIGLTLAELFEYLTGTMPKGNPESLTPSEYAQIVAYLLKINGMPAGGDSLPTDSESLRTIRIDTTAKVHNERSSPLPKLQRR